MPSITAWAPLLRGSPARAPGVLPLNGGRGNMSSTLTHARAVAGRYTP